MNNRRLLVFFDIGGVLVDHIASLRKIAQLTGLLEERMIAFYMSLADDLDSGRLSWDTFEERFYTTFPSITHQPLPLVELFVNNFGKIKETQDLMREMQERADVGLLSSISQEVFDLMKERSVLPTIPYKTLILSYKIEIVKPDKRIFEYAQKQAGALPQHILYIDDKEENLKVTQEMGWNTILFNTHEPAQSVEMIREAVKNLSKFTENN